MRYNMLGMNALQLSNKLSRGFSVGELLVVVAVVTLIAALSATSFVNLNKTQVIDKTALLALSVLDEARSLTLASKNSLQYGVHFEDSKVVLFTGTAYSSGDSTNQVNLLNTAAKTLTISLAGGGSEVIFDRLTGATSQNGSVTFSLRSDSNTTKTITVYTTGTAQSN